MSLCPAVFRRVRQATPLKRFKLVWFSRSAAFKSWILSSVCPPQVIVEKVSGSQIVDIDKRKYLVPSDITVAQFMWIIRKRIQLPSEKAIFLFVDKTVPQSR